MRTFISFIAVLILCSVCAGEIIRVPGGASTIQEGIDNASIGDTVLLGNATFYENIVIDKTLHLFGQSPDASIIDGSDSGDVVYINANTVHIRGLTITHAGDSMSEWGSQYEAPDAGIKIVESDSCVIEYCRFVNNLATGLGLTLSSYNTIQRCRFDNNNLGIQFYLLDDGPLDSNFSNRILGNIMTGNVTGIDFDHTTYCYHHSSLIRGNLISGSSSSGMVMTMSEQNDVSHNCLKDNERYGINHFTCSGGGDQNTFHHNAFIDNYNGGIQGYNTCDEIFEDYWYSQEDDEGNYWSDYTGSDYDSNGIGDIPYELDGFGCVDWYPLMQYEDSDSDNVMDSVDNCLEMANPDQVDLDFDFVGDDCDNCVGIWNPDQADSNSDSIGDACEAACGDADHSGSVDIDDVVSLISYIFAGGPAPIPLAAGDVDCSGGVDIDDVVYLVTYIFAGGNPPCDTNGDEVPDC